MLREPFYRAVPWQYTDRKQVFCITAYPAPFKGLHLAIRAAAILRNRIPNFKLLIAGALLRNGIRKDGYIDWLTREIRRLGIESNVEWLGPLEAQRIVDAMEAASAVLVPSYIENCCNAMQEAMIVGTPVVASYAGGLPSLAKSEESTLFFPPGDAALCAYQLERVLTDKGLAEQLSTAAREIAMIRNDQDKIISHYLEMYRHIIGDSKGGRA
jgi:glycosyltransferase involved in cell wall biosynthesis